MIKCKWDIFKYGIKVSNDWDADHIAIKRWASDGDWELLSGAYCFYAPYVKLIRSIQHVETP